MGGVERGTLEIAEAILGAGGRAIVITSGGALAGRITRAGGTVLTLAVDSKNPARILANAATLRRLIRRHGIDILHARSRAPAWSGWLATRGTDVPFITTYHGTYTEGLPFKRLYNSVMARGRPVIAVSHFIKDRILARHGIPEDQIVVIPRGADVAVFSEDAVGATRTVQLAEQWGLLDDPRPVVMMPGRLTRWKGAESLIDAAARLKSLRGAADFLILLVGMDQEGGFERVLTDRIRRLGLTDCVHLAGGCSDMAAAYKLAAVVVSSSIEPEAFGRVVVEAQAMGRPVIATDHGGARETVADGTSGWLYPPGDVERLAQAIHQALSLDPSARAHMGLAGRVRIHSQYTLAAMQRATLAVYEQAVGRSFAELI